MQSVATSSSATGRSPVGFTRNSTVRPCVSRRPTLRVERSGMVRRGGPSRPLATCRPILKCWERKRPDFALPSNNSSQGISGVLALKMRGVSRRRSASCMGGGSSVSKSKRPKLRNASFTTPSFIVWCRTSASATTCICCVAACRARLSRSRISGVNSVMYSWVG